ncbi:hypothetical protein Tco_0870865 [Tanacetum coccineum]
MIITCLLKGLADDTITNMVLDDYDNNSKLDRGTLDRGCRLKVLLDDYDNRPKLDHGMLDRFHERMKHINVRYHFIREIVESKEIEVAKIGTKDNAADAFTKVVPGLKFKYCMEILGVRIN